MLTVWRMVTARYAESSFSGEGAKRYGGRWNRKGIPMVYTAGSQSLALLEMLVQDGPLRARYVMIPAEVPMERGIERVGLDQLPSNWRDQAAVEQLKNIGSGWATGLSSAVLAVPSAVIPAETNYLLNPRHPGFAEISIGEPQELVTDLRLIESRS
ncbi:MAG: RES domain-containing protein [Chromatiaceae bacterium]|nr:RES domain-containing protein [Chromatiaceae bacterium]